MDPLANAKNISEGQKKQNAKEIQFLSTKCLAYDALRNALGSAEVFCGNDFPSSPEAESAHLLTLQALILQRLGEISSLEGEEGHTPLCESSSPSPRSRGAEADQTPHALEKTSRNQGPGSSPSGAPPASHAPWSEGFAASEKLGAGDNPHRSRSQSSSSNSNAGVTQPPAFEAEGNPPALHDLVMAHRKTLGCLMRTTAETFGEVNKRIESVEKRVASEADDSWNLESAFESLRTNLSQRVSCVEKQLAELAEGSKVRHGQLEFMLNTLRRQFARLSPAFNPPVPSITETCEHAPPPPPEPSILEMLEYAIRDAWNAKDWLQMTSLCNQYRELRNTL